MFHEFQHTKKWNRIKEFDDELDIESLKLLLESIKREVEKLQGKFDLDKFTKYFTNEFKFERPMAIHSESQAEGIEAICKMYLRYDYVKEQRPSKEQEINFISRILKEKKIAYKRNYRVKGSLNDLSFYDYTFMGYGVKMISLKKKEINRMFNDIKAWAWNCQYNQDVIKTIILYDLDSDTNEKNKLLAESALKILKQSSEYVFPITEGLGFINDIANVS